MTLAPQCVTFVKFYCSKCSRCTEKFCSAQRACIVCSQGSAFAFFSGGGEVEAVLVAAFLGVNHFLRVFCLLLTSNLYQHTHAHTHQSHWASVWAYNFMYMCEVTALCWGPHMCTHLHAAIPCKQVHAPSAHSGSILFMHSGDLFCTLLTRDETGYHCRQSLDWSRLRACVCTCREQEGRRDERPFMLCTSLVCGPICVPASLQVSAPVCVCLCATYQHQL